MLPCRGPALEDARVWPGAPDPELPPGLAGLAATVLLAVSLPRGVLGKKTTLVYRRLLLRAGFCLGHALTFFVLFYIRIFKAIRR